MFEFVDYNGNSINVNYKSILINGDFQINQRGKTVYTDNDYTLDMWYFYKRNNLTTGTNASLSINNDGSIKMSCNNYNWINISQKIDNYYRGKIVTGVIKVKNVKTPAEINNENASVTYPANIRIVESETIYGVYDETSYEVTKIESDGIYHFTANIPEKSTYSMLKISVLVFGEIDIEYIDLYEGEIAYLHVKEDKTNAQLKCLSYVRPITYNIVAYCTASNYIQETFIFDIPMVSTPRFTIIDYGTGSNVEDAKVSVSYNRVVLQIVATRTGLIYIHNKKYLFTCEPLE